MSAPGKRSSTGSLLFPKGRPKRKKRPASSTGSLLFPKGRRSTFFKALKYKKKGIFAVSKASGAVYKCKEQTKRKCTKWGGKKNWIGNPRSATGKKKASLERRLPKGVLKAARG